MNAVIRDLRILSKYRERSLTPADRAASLSTDLRDAWEERAAIMEFDAHMTRNDAERRAFNLIPGPSGAPTKPPRQSHPVAESDPFSEGVEAIFDGQKIWSAPGHEDLAF